MEIAGNSSGMTQVGHPEGTWSSPGYRSGRTRAKWAQALFILTALASIWQVALALNGIALAGRALEGDTPSAFELDSFIRSADGAQGFFILCAIGLAITFLAWLSRTVEIVPALGAGTPHDSPRWAIGWWFIPIAFLWKPYTVVRETWDRLATPPRTSGGTLVIGWWLCWIGATILGRIASAMADSASSWEAVQNGFWVSFGSSVLSVAAAVSGFMVVREIQARADTRAVGLGFDPQPRALPSATAGSLPAPQSASVLSPVVMPPTSRAHTAPDGDSPTPPDPAEVLRRLNDLREQGLITEEEFTAKRADVISRL